MTPETAEATLANSTWQVASYSEKDAYKIPETETMEAALRTLNITFAKSEGNIVVSGTSSPDLYERGADLPGYGERIAGMGV